MGVVIVASLGLAEGENTIDVDAQIETIQNASPEKRYELMNEFKQKLMQLNETQRSETIAKMREKMMQMHSGRMHGGRMHGRAMGGGHRFGHGMMQSRMHQNQSEMAEHIREHQYITPKKVIKKSLHNFLDKSALLFANSKWEFKGGVSIIAKKFYQR